MNDEQILERGGTERDIEEYAKANGADLTETDFKDMNQKQSWEEEFDSFFEVRRFGIDTTSWNPPSSEIMKNFIKQAIQTREREIGEEVEKFPTTTFEDDYGEEVEMLVRGHVLHIINNKSL